MRERRGNDPEGAVSIGLLMEIAQAHQQLAEASLAALKEHTAGMDAVVREQIRRTLIEQLHEVHVQSERTVESLRQVQKTVDRRIAIWSVRIAALSALVGALVGYGTVHVLRELVGLCVQRHG